MSYRKYRHSSVYRKANVYIIISNNYFRIRISISNHDLINDRTSINFSGKNVRESTYCVANRRMNYFRVLTADRV